MEEALLSLPPVKPPNILVYQASKDTTDREFVRIKESLVSCLTPERYTVYALGFDDITEHAPWQDNCRLVIIPPGALSNSETAAVKELVSYVKNGGSVISLDGTVNKALGQGSPSDLSEQPTGQGSPLDLSGQPTGQGSPPDLSEQPTGQGSLEGPVCTVEALLSDSRSARSVFTPDSGVEGDKKEEEELITFSAYSLRSHDPEGMTASDCFQNQKSVLLATHPHTSSPTYLPQEDMERVSRDTMAFVHAPSSTHQPLTPDTPPTLLSSGPPDGVDQCVQKMVFKSGGCAVLSRVDFLPLLPSNINDAPLLVRLKKDVKMRTKFLAHVLCELSLECSEESAPRLSHTYLVCSKQVCVSCYLS